MHEYDHSTKSKWQVPADSFYTASVNRINHVLLTTLYSSIKPFNSG